MLRKINNLIAKIKPNVLLFHPDCVNDFNWLNKRYDDLLAFENMDKEKLFGRTINDLKEVFYQCTNAKWVFDLNHLYTNDKTMKSAKDFYNAFSDKLCHYHLSSYGGFHDCFCKTHEDKILEGLTDLSKPIVHEGNVVERGLLQEESEYIKKNISDN